MPSHRLVAPFAVWVLISGVSGTAHADFVTTSISRKVDANVGLQDSTGGSQGGSANDGGLLGPFNQDLTGNDFDNLGNSFTIESKMSSSVPATAPAYSASGEATFSGFVANEFWAASDHSDYHLDFSPSVSGTYTLSGSVAINFPDPSVYFGFSFEEPFAAVQLSDITPVNPVGIEDHLVTLTPRSAPTTVIFSDSVTLAAGDTYALFAFADIYEPGNSRNVNGSVSVSYDFTLGPAAGSAAPEPSSLVLLGSASVILVGGWLRRRGRSAPARRV